MTHDIAFGETKKIHFGCGTLYITTNFDTARKPIQILMQVGKAGCCQRILLEAMCRLANRILDDNKPLDEITDCLVGLRCDQGVAGAGRLSCADALGQLLKSYTIAATAAPVIPEPAHDIQVQQVQ